MKRIERAIISVYDKTGIKEFAKTLVNEFNIEILSTGGTGALLEKNNIPYVKISEYTSSPELFEGRVKTLHPKIAGGILFRRDLEKDIKDSIENNIPPIDMVVCNLYPFKQTISRPDVTLKEAIEMIDIGGPTMIRAAAKNYHHVVVVPAPACYSQIIDELRKNDGIIPEKLRVELAIKAFSLITDYNSTITNFLLSSYHPSEMFKPVMFKTYQKVSDLRYGENWDQRAAYYRDLASNHGLFDFKQLHGKDLSFNNYLDIDSCIQILLDFGIKNHVTTIIKHTSPNGVAMDEQDQLISVKKAFSTDPLSAFGGIWGFNSMLTEEVANYIVNEEKVFLEVIMAPSYESKAIEILKQKKNLIILEFGDFLEKRSEIYSNPELRSVLGGVVVQEYDHKPVVKEWNVVSKKKINEEDKKALIFAYKVSKWAKSNSACFAQIYDTGIYTIGIGAGQQSRVHVIELAVRKAKQFGHEKALIHSYLGTDSFFPFPDGLEVAVKAGAKAIINPGGSIRDDLVIHKADELNCALVFCGKRVFRH